MSDAQEIQDQPTEAIPANVSQKEEESRDEMLSRHRYIVL
jgi:OTU domain-containing protein 6